MKRLLIIECAVLATVFVAVIILGAVLIASAG